MTIRKRPVAVMQLPEQVTRKQVRNITRELERSMSLTRPYLVLDCSNVRHFDNPAVHLILHCLEEAMKRNGDVKLAGLPLTANATLGAAATNRLFEIFDTTAEAVNSFHQLPFQDVSETGESESAA
jgi:anti-anti-sigma regulatory factor